MEAALLGVTVAAWAVVHSWLATNAVKAKAIEVFGEAASRFYRLAYNLFSVVSLGPVAWLMWILPDRQIYRVPAPWAIAMLTVQGAAAVLAAVTLLQTGALHFAGLAQIFGRSERGTLLSTGFYRLVRHPLYLFGLAFLWFSPAMSMNRLAINAVITAYLFIGALQEERRLVREFGVAYEVYRSSTPMIIPRGLPRR